MGRSGILDEQSRAAKVLIKIIKTGIPAMNWFIADDVPRCVSGTPVVGLGDSELYVTLVNCAERLGLQLKVIPQGWLWHTEGSDSEHAPPAIRVRSDREKYVIKGVYHGVQVSCWSSASEGTAEKTTVTKARQAGSRDPVVTAQLQALTVMIGLLSADLPPLCWRIDAGNHEPQLNLEIGTYGRRWQARVELNQWADFLGTPIRYDPSSMYRNFYNPAEVTTHVDGVSITITARLRRPLSDTRLWHALRRKLTRTSKPTTAQ